MRKFASMLFVFVFVFATLLISGCSDIKDVPPQEVGRILTPTGWEDKLYSPGQVDIGAKDNQGRGNTLVLIQTSGFQVKETFLGSQANEDKEDHRVFTKDKTPVSIDIRFLFTCPDISKEEKSVKRFFTLGNPTPDEKDSRIMHISLLSIYNDQGKMQIRGKIRDIIAGYKDFNDLFDNRDNVNIKFKQIISEILVERGIPLVLVDCQISNMKPDPLVWENQIKLQAAQVEIDTMTKLQDYLDRNPTARMIFVLSKLKEIAAIASEKGNNTIIISTVGGSEFSPDKSIPLILNQKGSDSQSVESVPVVSTTSK